MPFCVNCGTKLPDTAKFCHNCGTPVGSIPASPAHENTAKPISLGPSKEELIGYLVAYAGKLLSLEKAIKSLFTYNLREAPFEFTNEAGCMTLNNLQNDYRSKVVFEWEHYLSRDVIKNQFNDKITYPCNWNNYTYIHLDQYGGHFPEHILPKAINNVWLIYCKTIDEASMNLFQTKLRSFFDSLGKTDDLKRLDGYKIGDYSIRILSELLDLSKLGIDQFSKSVKSSDVKFNIVKSLWDVRELIQTKRIGRWKTVSVTTGVIFKKTSCMERFIEIDASSLVKQLDEIIKIFPTINDFINDYLPVYCDAIDALAKNMQKSFTKIWNLPLQYRDSASAAALARILMDGKADTWKEAVNLFDTESFRDKVLDSLGDISQQIISLNKLGGSIGEASTAILDQMKITNAQLKIDSKKLSSITTSTLITAVFGD